MFISVLLLVYSFSQTLTLALDEHHFKESWDHHNLLSWWPLLLPQSKAALCTDEFSSLLQYSLHFV